MATIEWRDSRAVTAALSLDGKAVGASASTGAGSTPAVAVAADTLAWFKRVSTPDNMATAQTLHYSMSHRAIGALEGLLQYIAERENIKVTNKEKRLRVSVCDGDVSYTIKLKDDASPDAVESLRSLCVRVRQMLVEHTVDGSQGA